MKKIYSTILLLISLFPVQLWAQSGVTITSQPANVPICTKSYVPSISFSVAATGSGLNYQWQSLNGSTWSNLPDSNYTERIVSGANTAQLTFGLGMYIPLTVRCLITSGNGSPVYTEPASTVLAGRPVIQSGPTASQAVCPGGTVTLSASATGYDLKYKWRRYGSSDPISGTGIDSPNLTLTNVQSTANGLYYAEISNLCGTISTPYYQLTASRLPVISQQPPTTKVVSASQTNSLCAVADNGGQDISGINYYTQWEARADANAAWTNVPATVEGSSGGPYTSGTHCLPNLPVLTNGQQYRLKLSIQGCSEVLYSAITTLQNQTVVTITTQPTNLQGCVNSNSSFSVAATGDGLSYLWETRANTSSAWTTLTDGANASGANTAQVTIFGALQTNGRQVRVKVSGGSSSLYSNAATLSLKGPIVYTLHPADLAICPGVTARFQTAINNNGAGTVNIRWEYNNGTAWVPATGTGFSGGNTGNLYVSGTQLVNGRQFRVVASAASCPNEIASNPALLKVDAAYAPVLTGLAPEVAIKSGTTVQTIPVSATGGSGALKITWTRTNVTGLNFSPALAQSGTDAEFTVSRTITSTSTTNQALVFTVKATDAVGCSSSAQTKVTVQPGTINARLGIDGESPVSVLTLFPNPSNGRVLHIRGSEVDQKSIALYNVSGAALPVTSRAVDTDLTEVKPIETLSSGLYVLKVLQGTAVQYHRVVVE